MTGPWWGSLPGAAPATTSRGSARRVDVIADGHRRGRRRSRRRTEELVAGLERAVGELAEAALDRRDR